MTAARRLLRGRKAKRYKRDFTDLVALAKEAQRYGVPLRAFLESFAISHPDAARRSLRLLDSEEARS